MGEGDSRVERILLPDGTPVWARISGAGELTAPATPGGLSYTDTGFADRVTARMESLHGLVAGVARTLGGALDSVRPDEVSVEFGIELAAKGGKVVGLLADGEVKGALKVTLTWHGGGPPPEPAEDADTANARGSGGVSAGAHSGSGAQAPPGGDGAGNPS